MMMIDWLPKGGIYMIRNSRSGKSYIGSAVFLERRKRDHFRLLRAGKHHSKKLQHSFDLHGESAFSFIVLVRCTDVASLVPLEQRFIDFHQSAGLAGYNVRPKAESNLGHKFSEEVRRKNADAQRGKKHSIETRAKMSEAHMGRKASAEHARNISAGKTGLKRPDVSVWAPEKLSMFNSEQVAAIRADRVSGLKYKELAAKYRCSEATAHFVVNGTGAFYSRV